MDKAKKYLNGQVTIIHLVGWGLVISMAVTSAFFARIGNTDAKVTDNKSSLEDFKEKVSEDRVEYTRSIASIETQIGGMVKTLDRIEKKFNNE